MRREGAAGSLFHCQQCPLAPYTKSLVNALNFGWDKLPCIQRAQLGCLQRRARPGCGSARLPPPTQGAAATGRCCAPQLKPAGRSVPQASHASARGALSSVHARQAHCAAERLGAGEGTSASESLSCVRSTTLAPSLSTGCCFRCCDGC